MNQNTRVDSVERALQLLRSEQWTGPDQNPRIEEALMQIASTNKAPARAVARKTLYIAIGGAFLLGAAGASGARAIYDAYVVRFHGADGSEFTAEVHRENGQIITSDGRRLEFYAKEGDVPKDADAQKPADGPTFTTQPAPTASSAPPAPAAPR